MVVNALPGFNDWYIGTGSAYLTAPGELKNQLTRRNYMGRFFQAGRDTKEMLKGGTSLKHAINLTLDASAGPYIPGSKRKFNHVDGIDYAESGWMFEEAWTSFLDAEDELQGVGEFTKKGRIQTFTKHAVKKEQNMFTDYNEYRERTYWATPNAKTMEQTQGKPKSLARQAMPINVFVNMFSELEHNVFADGLPPGFTTVLGLDPRDYVDPQLNIDPVTKVAKSPWDNQRVTYSKAGLAGAAQNLSRALSACMRISRFERMPIRPDLSEGANNSASTFARFGILTTNWGIQVYEATLEAGNERFRAKGNQDMHFDGITFDGQPLAWVEELGNTKIYAEKTNSGTLAADTLPALVREDQAENAAPHFYFCNFEDGLLEFFHEGHMFKKHTPYFLPEQPDVMVGRHSVWRNLHCESRRVLGVVGPAYDPAVIDVPQFDAA